MNEEAGPMYTRFFNQCGKIIHVDRLVATPYILLHLVRRHFLLSWHLNWEIQPASVGVGGGAVVAHWTNTQEVPSSNPLWLQSVP